MEHLFTLLLVIGSATTAHAQLLLNPSFEDDTGGNLDHWEHACMAHSVMGAAPSSGSWCAEVEASNPQGCFPARMYQIAPTAYPGMPFQLGGWCRVVPGLGAPTVGIDIGLLDQLGNITLLDLGLTTTDTTWTWVSTYDTLHLGLEEQAVVVCNSGWVGGPAWALAQFDGILFRETSPTSIAEVPVLNTYCDGPGGQLVVNCSNAPITHVHVCDPSGRMVPAGIAVVNAHAVRISFAMLTPGIYVAAVGTARGVAPVRFVVER